MRNDMIYHGKVTNIQNPRNNCLHYCFVVQSHNGLSRKVNDWASLVADPNDILPETEELLRVIFSAECS